MPPLITLLLPGIILCLGGAHGKDAFAPGAVVETYGHNPSHIYRGMKWNIWDGGHRVPFIVRWPGQVRPGTRRKVRLGRKIKKKDEGVNDGPGLLIFLPNLSTSSSGRLPLEGGPDRPHIRLTERDVGLGGGVFGSDAPRGLCP